MLFLFVLVLFYPLPISQHKVPYFLECKTRCFPTVWCLNMWGRLTFTYEVPNRTVPNWLRHNIKIQNTCFFKIFDTTNTIFGENCVSSRVQVYKPQNITVLFHHCISQQYASTSHHKWLERVFLRSVVYPVHWLRLMMICRGTAVKRMGMLGVSMRKMKAPSVKMVTVILIGKGK